jgi:hypothetical protein
MVLFPCFITCPSLLETVGISVPKKNLKETSILFVLHFHTENVLPFTAA